MYLYRFGTSTNNVHFSSFIDTRNAQFIIRMIDKIQMSPAFLASNVAKYLESNQIVQSQSVQLSRVATLLIVCRRSNQEMWKLT